MPTLTYSPTVSGMGVNPISKQISRTGDGGSVVEISVAKGYAGTLSTRTDDETGTLTLGAGHAITTGQIIDLYWSGGARFAILVGTVSGTSVPIGADDSGTGDVLPAESTAVVASPRVAFNCAVDGDELGLLAMQLVTSDPSLTTAGHISMLDGADDEIAELDLVANIPRVWDVEGGDTNPFTGDPITDAVASNANSTYDATFRMLWVQDATP